MTLGLILTVILVVVAIGGVFLGLQPENASGQGLKRLRSTAQRSAARRAEAAGHAADASAVRRRQNTQEALKELANESKRSRKRQVSVRGRIEQAGLKLSEGTFWMIAGSVGAVFALAGFLIQGSLIGAAIGAFIGGFGLPRWVLGFLVNRRTKKFTNQLADAIDVIVRGVKSGLPLNQCLRIISAESPEPLASEFRSLVDGQAMGVPLEQNLNKMFERMPLPEVNFFNIVLIIQQKTGGNLAESLSNLSTVLRARKMMLEKVKALSSEAKASAMIIGSLPFIVMGLVYMVRPEYMTLLFTETAGQVILLGAAVMMTTGILVMKKMVNFKF